MKQPIDDPKELLMALDESTRRDIANVIALSDFQQIDRKISDKIVKSHNFRLALIHKLNEVLRDEGIFYDR